MTLKEALALTQSRLRKYENSEVNYSASMIKMEFNLARSQFFNDADVIERVKQIPTVASTETISLGQEVGHTKALYIISGTDKKLLIQISSMDLPVEHTKSGEPECYYIKNDNTVSGEEIGLYPIPDAIYNIDVHYKLDPNRTLTDTDDIEIEDKYVSGVISLAVSNLVQSIRVSNELHALYRDTVMTAKGDADGSRASIRDTMFWDPRDDFFISRSKDYGKGRYC